MTDDERLEIEDRIGDQRDPPSVCAVCSEQIRYEGDKVLCEHPQCYEPMHKVDCSEEFRCDHCGHSVCPNHWNRFWLVCSACQPTLGSPATSANADAPFTGDAEAAVDGAPPPSQERDRR